MHIKLLVISLVILVNIKLQGQEEIAASKLEWFKTETSITGDFIKNLQGGINTDFAYIGLEELCLTFNMEELGWWKGGEFFFHGLNSHGLLPSQDIVGDLQVSSNIEAGDYLGFYEFYYTHSFGNLSLLIGQHDLNSEFVGTEYGGTFINSSFGISPSMSLNVPVSIYPLASLAFISKYQTDKGHAFKLGVYDGDPGDPENNRYNIQPTISSDEGVLLIGEYELSYLINGLPENYKLGLYYHTGSFTDYEDTLKSIQGNYGAYGISDFVLCSGFNHPETYLGLFIQGGWAPSKINQIDYYVGGGVHLNGILPKRYKDALGIAFAFAHISKDVRALDANLEYGEVAYELTYKIHVFDQYSIQPNLQYIANPGANKSLKDALVATIRFNVTLEN